MRATALETGTKIFPWFGATLLSALAAGGSWADNAATSQVSYSTPPGITLVDVVYELFNSTPLSLWTHLGGPGGETLYIYDKDVSGRSACIGECAEEFPPVIALPGAKAYGDWSLIKRDSGKQQWAYRGKPLYRFAKETRIDEVVSNLAKEFKGADILSSQSDNDKSGGIEPQLLPPEGWRVAKFEPASGMTTPVAVAVQEIPAAGLLGLVDHKGHTLYTFSGGETEFAQLAHQDEQRWMPLIAPEVSGSVGEFTPLRRADGTRQWAWRGTPLYIYSGDRLAGEINGVRSALNPDVDARWSIPAIAHHFTPLGVEVREDRVRGLMLSTPRHLPLYTRQPDKLVSSDRLHFFQNYYRGKRLGTKGCNAECEKTWQPFTVSAEAHSQGYWEVVERDDGVRQWAYKGFAQYIYTGDQPGGQALGNNRYDYVIGNSGPYKPADVIPDYGEFSLSYIAFPSLVWRLSSP